MRIFSYHIVELPLLYALKALLFPLKPDKNLGLLYVETMSMMNLGSPIYAWSRIFNNKIIVFAQWENEASLNDFLTGIKWGKQFGDAGFYFLLNDSRGNFWVKFVSSFTDQLIVSQVAGKLRAKQTLKLWSMTVVNFDYDIEKVGNPKVVS